MAEGPDPSLGIDERIARHDGQLPEAAADEGEPIGPDHADPDQPELGIRSADDDRRARRESGLVRRPGRESAHDRARLEHLGDDIGRQADELERRRRPAPGPQVEQVGARARGGIRHEPAGEPVEHPVAEHPHVGDPGEDLGLVGLDPQEARRRGDRDPVAALLEDPPSPAVPDEFGRLIGGPGVHVGTGPDLVPVAVVEDHALAHARAAHPGDVGRRDRRPGERLPDALADEPPVPRRVEDLGARRPRQCRVGPLALADGDLSPVLREQDSPAAAGPEVDGEGVAHRLAGPPATSATRPGATSRAARSATLRSGVPATKRSISSTAISPPWASVSYVAPPMCVAMRTLG